jgi:serine/threonine-protein kinase
MLAQGATIGRYHIKRKLAEGGMAEIYLASAEGPEGFAKEVVIKVVRSFLASDKQFVDMFIAEARLASRLNHANVVQIFDFGKHEDSYYLAMEYVRGASLWDLRKRCRELGLPFPPVLAAEVGTQVARGLHYAHTLSERGKPLGVVHRDVTPHNVLLSFEGAVKLTDFGIAKAQSTHTAPGMLKGKFAYMSPEQAQGEAVDARTDVFALGIVLWELLTGGRLFDGDSDVQVLRAVQEATVVPPTRLNPDIPAELSGIVLKALARPLAERFQSAQELERALANFVLKHAKSMEETQVSTFLQQAFREEFEAPQRPGTPAYALPAVQRATPADDFGLGDTRAFDRSKQFGGVEQTMTATPAPAPKPRTEQMPALRPSARLPPVIVQPGLSEARPPSSTDVVPAQPFAATEKIPAITDEMLAGKRAPTRSKVGSRPAAPAPEPSVVVAPVTAPKVAEPQVTQSLTETDPRLNGPSRLPLLSGLLGVGLLVGGGGWYALRPAPEPVPVPSPAPVAVAVIEPALVKAEPAPAPEKALEAATPPPTAPPSEKLPEKLPDIPVAQVPEVVAKPVPVPVPVPVRAPAQVALGHVEIDARPFATVTAAGKKYEIRGAGRIDLKPGTWELLFEHPRARKTISVTVEAGKSTAVVFHPLESE